MVDKVVMIVEDDDDIRNGLVLFLSHEGYRTCSAINGDEAFKYLLELGEDLPGLILLDLFMPFIDGLQLHEMLKKNPLFSSIPIVAVTASAKRDVPAGMELLRKPIDLDQLLALVRKHCGEVSEEHAAL